MLDEVVHHFMASYLQPWKGKFDIVADHVLVEVVRCFMASYLQPWKGKLPQYRSSLVDIRVSVSYGHNMCADWESLQGNQVWMT